MRINSYHIFESWLHAIDSRGSWIEFSIWLCFHSNYWGTSIVKKSDTFLYILLCLFNFGHSKLHFYNGLALVRCRVIIYNPMPIYCQFDHQYQHAMQLEIQNFLSNKMNLKFFDAQKKYTQQIWFSFIFVWFSLKWKVFILTFSALAEPKVFILTTFCTVMTKMLKWRPVGFSIVVYHWSQCAIGGVWNDTKWQIHRHSIFAVIMLNVFKETNKYKPTEDVENSVIQTQWGLEIARPYIKHYCL